MTETTTLVPPATHIVVVEDDPAVSELLREALQLEGFGVTTASNGRELKAILASQPVHLITLDLGLPDEDGIELAREIYAHHDTPIIIVTGKSNKVSRIVGLEIGADDYIVKPFDLDELVARVRAVLRRARRNSATQSPSKAPEGLVMFDRWRYDISGRRLQDPNGEYVDLTSSELELLTIFVRSPRTVLARAAIAEELRGDEAEATAERSIDVLVGRLRRKLERHAEGQEIIKTVRGEGYIFSAEVQSL